jgi:hypothetical protein
MAEPRAEWGEKFSERDLQCRGEPVDDVQRRRLGTPFQIAQIGRVQARPVGRFLLRQAKSPPEGPQALSEDPAQILHGRMVGTFPVRRP